MQIQVGHRIVVAICLCLGGISLPVQGAVVDRAVEPVTPAVPAPALPQPFNVSGLSAGYPRLTPEETRERLPKIGGHKSAVTPLPPSVDPLNGTSLKPRGAESFKNATVSAPAVQSTAPAASGPQFVEVPVVPEPSTGLLLAASALLALTRRGHRKRPRRPASLDHTDTL